MLLQEGRIGRFDLQALLLTLVTGMGLLASAGLAVDALAIYAMPLRERYYSSKYEVTDRFQGLHHRSGGSSNTGGDGGDGRLQAGGAAYRPLSGERGECKSINTG